MFGLCNRIAWMVLRVGASLVDGLSQDTLLLVVALYVEGALLLAVALCAESTFLLAVALWVEGTLLLAVALCVEGALLLAVVLSVEGTLLLAVALCVKGALRLTVALCVGGALLLAVALCVEGTLLLALAVALADGAQGTSDARGLLLHDLADVLQLLAEKFHDVRALLHNLLQGIARRLSRSLPELLHRLETVGEDARETWQHGGDLRGLCGTRGSIGTRGGPNGSGNLKAGELLMLGLAALTAGLGQRAGELKDGRSS